MPRGAVDIQSGPNGDVWKCLMLIPHSNFEVKKRKESCKIRGGRRVEVGGDRN